jgi:hypothetical protein
MVRQAKSTTRNKNKNSDPIKPSPVSNIGSIASLKRYNDKDHANSLLHEIVKLTAPIIHENNFKVGTVCEMFPKDPNLLGLNVNRGQKILIRLRYHSNDRLFLPMSDLVGTFLHELTHNIYGAHDSKFYKFLDNLKSRYDTLQYNKTSLNGYRCEENRLGTNLLSTGYLTLQQKRIKAHTSKFKSETRQLGTLLEITNSKVLKPDMKSLRDLRLQAIERMRKDSKWCNNNEKKCDIEPNDDEIEIIEVKDLGKINPEYKEVVDLTNEEYGEPSQEIIVIDGCASSSKMPMGRTSISSASEDESVKSHDIRGPVPVSKLLPSFDDEKKMERHENHDDTDYISYSLSSSPSHFIEGDSNRHKFVANLNIQQILEKGKQITQVRVPEKKKKKRALKKKKSVQKLPHHLENSEQPKPKKTVKPILFKDLF